MPIINGDYVKRTQSELSREIDTALRDEFGEVDLSQSAVFDTWSEAIAAVLAANQEVSLDTVYDSAFVSTAQGDSLENVVELIGLDRLDPIKATGSVTFSSDDIVTQSYGIPNGTTVSTSGGRSYQTTETVNLELHHDFDGGTPLSDFSGDTGSFTINTTDTYDGSSGSLESAGGSVGTILSDTATASRGMTQTCRMKFTNNAGSGPDSGQYLYLGTSSSVAYGAEVDATNGELNLIYRGSQKAGSTGLTIPYNEWLRIEATAYVDLTHEITLYDASGTEIDTITWDESSAPNLATFDGTVGIIADNGEVLFDELSMRAVTADIEAVEGGSEYNIGGNSITQVSTGLSGVDSLTNRFAIGNTDIRDTDGDSLIAGEDEEDDSELRQRAKETTSGGGGSATVDAIASHIKSANPSVSSVTVFKNSTGSADAQGLPAYSFEAVVSGGADSDIAKAIFERQGVTSHDASGNYGTGVSVTVTSDETGDDYTVEFSRPTVIDVDVTVDIVVNDNFSGKADVKDDIVSYIGGTLVDGSTTDGTDVGEDVYIDQLKDIIVGSENGVIGVSTISTTPTVSTDANGLDVVSIDTQEVAETDATDNSLTVNVTTV